MTSQASTEEIRAKIAELYDLPVEQVGASDGGFSWATNGIKGRYFTKHPYTLADFLLASFEFTKRPPSMDHVISCLGPPDSYVAWYFGPPDGNPILTFRMFYEQEGVAADWFESGKQGQLPPLNGTTLAGRLYYTDPDSPVGGLRSLELGMLEEQKAKIKPWPGSWDKIEIDIDPTAR